MSYSYVKNFVTASLHQVPQVAIRNSGFSALTVEIVQHGMGFSMQHIV